MDFTRTALLASMDHSLAQAKAALLAGDDEMGADDPGRALVLTGGTLRTARGYKQVAGLRRTTVGARESPVERPRA